MMRFVVLATMLGAFVAVAAGTVSTLRGQGLDGGREVAVTCRRPPVADDYLPPGSGDPTNADFDLVLRQYYASYFRAMRLWPLRCGAQAPDAIRLTRLEMQKPPTSVTIAKRWESAWNRTIVLDTQTWQAPPVRPASDVRRTISPGDWQDVLAAVERFDIGQRPFGTGRTLGNSATYVWLLEVRRGNRYVVTIEAAPISAQFVELATAIAGVADVADLVSGR